MLAVDDSLHYPAGCPTTATSSPRPPKSTTPAVIDDAVDELIELVLARGGRIAFTTPGTLAGHQGVAIITRR